MIYSFEANSFSLWENQTLDASDDNGEIFVGNVWLWCHDAKEIMILDLVIRVDKI